MNFDQLKTKKNLIQGLLFGTVTVAFVGGAAFLYRQSSDYLPGEGQSEFRKNEIVFPEDATVTNQSDQGGEDEGEDSWKKEDNSLDSRRPDSTNDVSQMFEHENQEINTINVAETQELQTETETSQNNGYVIRQGDNTPSLPLVVVNPEKQDSHKSDTTPGTIVIPEKTNPDDFPYIPKKDYDEKPANHPVIDGQSGIPMPSDGIIAKNPDNAAVFVDNMAGNSAYQLYRGEKIEPWKILYGLDLSIVVDGRTYQIVDENSKNIKFSSYPDYATDDFTIVISVRLNEDSPWMDAEISIPVYDQKVVFVRNDGETLWSVYGNIGDVIALNSYEYAETANTLFKSIDEDDTILEMPMGWSDSPNGLGIGNYYTIESTGLKIIYARKPLTLSPEEGFHVSRIIQYDTSLTYHLIVDDYVVDPWEDWVKQDLVVPYGITDIRNLYGRSLYIPGSVMSVDLRYGQILDAFIVAEDNPYFVVNEDGLLLSADETVLYGIPANLKEVDIPSTVTEIQCAFYANQHVYLHSDDVIAFDFMDNVRFMEGDGLTITVPDEQYFDYLLSWHVDYEHRKTLKSDQNPEKELYMDENGAIMEMLEDGTTSLHCIPENSYQLYDVPENVSEISADIFSYHDNYPVMFMMKDNVKKVDAAVFNEHENLRLYFIGDELPEIVHPEHFNGSMNPVSVREALFDEFMTTIVDLFGEGYEDIIYPGGDEFEIGEDGSIYLLLGDGDAMLMRAGENIETFTPESVPEGLTLSYIIEKAFLARKNLKFIDLPETVVDVEPYAFANCENLEGIMFETTTTLFLDEGIFDNDPSLRFVAANAKSVDVENTDDLGVIYDENEGLYGLNLTTEALEAYPEIDSVNVAEQYSIQKCGEGYLLYGDVVDSIDGTQTRYVLASTSTISGEITLLENTQGIFTAAFHDTYLPFHISEDSWNDVVVIYDRAFKNAIEFTGTSANPGEVTLTSSLLGIGTNVFEGCSKIQSAMIDLQYDEANVDALIEKYGELDEYYWGAAKMMYEQVHEIPREFFRGCTSLETVTFSEDTNINYIGSYSFSGTSLSHVDLPASLEEIGFAPFPMTLESLDLKMVDNQFAIPSPEPGTTFSFRDTENVNLGDDITITINGEHATLEQVQILIEPWAYAMLGSTDFENFYLTEQFNIPRNIEDRETYLTETVLKKMTRVEELVCSMFDVNMDEIIDDPLFGNTMEISEEEWPDYDDFPDYNEWPDYEPTPDYFYIEDSKVIELEQDDEVSEEPEEEMIIEEESDPIENVEITDDVDETTEVLEEESEESDS